MYVLHVLRSPVVQLWMWNGSKSLRKSVASLAHVFKAVHSLPKPSYFLPYHYALYISYYYPYLEVFICLLFSHILDGMILAGGKLFLSLSYIVYMVDNQQLLNE